MHFVLFADVSPDKPQSETDCCGFSVYSVVVQIDVQYCGSGMFAVEHCKPE